MLLLLELLGGAGSTSMLAANCYVGGHNLREFRPAAVAVKGEQMPATGAKQGTGAAEEEPSFEDLAAISRIAVDVMWP
jgi:hypothetical protein